MTKDIKNFLAHLSHHPGVYQMLGENGEVLYVGKAKDLKKRVSNYFTKKIQDVKTQTLVNYIKDIAITVTHTETEAVLLECNLIKKHQPRYNILLRDDKSYPYILITDRDPYPRIDFYRGSRRKNHLYFGPYPSAYAVRDTISLMQKMFKIRTCRDSYFKARTRPCLLHQINRCSAPCVGAISHENYAADVKLAILFLQGKNTEVIQLLQFNMEQAAHALNYELAGQYRDQIKRLRQMQDKQYVTIPEGNADIIGIAQEMGIVCIQLLSIRQGQLVGSRPYFPKVPSNSTMSEVLSAFLTQYYLYDVSHQDLIPRHIILNEAIDDQAWLAQTLSDLAEHPVSFLKPTREEKKQWFEIASSSAKQSLSTHLYNQSNLTERLQALKEIFELSHLPQRIECFDISHIQGEATVASCVVFDQNGPVKNDYRRFNIKNITPGDDIAAMQQVLKRRFFRLQHEAGKFPDLVFIDGGELQLNAAYQILQTFDIKKLTLIGISKGPGRKAGFEALHRLNLPPIHLPADSKALLFIQQIRDEAHRFAITGHRNQRDKKRRHSTLETIPGIGSKRRRDLLRYFGGIQGVSRASLDELMKVPGINRALAERIFAALHDKTL